MSKKTFKPFLVPSPAKLNWFLQIIAKLSSGYHTLHSYLQFLDLKDILKFSPSTTLDHQITTSPNQIQIQAQDHLVYKALKAIEPYAQHPKPIHIHLYKRIPIGAGLGGGSSNAATTLLTLRTLWDCRISDTELMRLSIKLGADIPFFIGQQSAEVQGVGEILIPRWAPEVPILLIFPSIQASTKEMFSSLETPYSGKFSFQKTHEIIKGKNDFEAVFKKRYPSLCNTLDELLKFGYPRLSGSGSTFYLVGGDIKKAWRHLQAHNKKDITIRLSHTRNSSELKTAIKWGVAKW